jgi:hypothetical protein
MKRTLVAALVLGLTTSLGVVGCGEKSEVQQTEKVSTPGGTTEVTKSTEVKSTGDNPPPTSSGTAEAPK